MTARTTPDPQATRPEDTSNRMVPAAALEAMTAERDGWQATAEVLDRPCADLVAAAEARMEYALDALVAALRALVEAWDSGDVISGMNDGIHVARAVLAAVEAAGEGVGE